VYLVGTALGAAVYARWASGPENRLRNGLLRLQCLACLVGMAALVVAEPMKLALASLTGAGMWPSLVIEAALACVAFLLPTVVMGALFSHLVTTARAGGVSFGAALGVNTIAAALAPLLFGVLLLPALGAAMTLVIVSAGYLLAAGAWKDTRQLAACLVVALFALWRPPLAAVDLPAGGRILSQDEGVAASVSIIEDADGIATLHINNRQQEGSSATVYADARQGLLPVLLHPEPRHVLFLGLGTGATARAAAAIETLRVDAVELLPGVIAASAHFAELQQDRSQSKLRLWPADARRFVRAAPDYYDVIVADNFHPARSGSAALYTREHFAAVRERLAAGGLFCQWLPLHQLDLETTRSIVRTYTAVYPRTWALLATNSLDTPVLGLIARRDGEAFTPDDIRAALSGSRADAARAIEINDDLALMGSFIAAPDSLSGFAGDAPLNTDDHSVVAWLAPRITYDPDSTPRARLLALLAELEIQPEDVFAAASDPGWRRRLAAYWNARDLYLRIGSAVRPTRDVQVMLARTRAPLLDVLRVSADFRPAYQPLVSMARELGRTDAAEARRLLNNLAAIRPDWHEASLALAELGAE
jgi:spermidine synthase